MGVCVSLGGREDHWTSNLTHTHMQQLQVSTLHEYHDTMECSVCHVTMSSVHFVLLLFNHTSYTHMYVPPQYETLHTSYTQCYTTAQDIYTLYTIWYSITACLIRAISNEINKFQNMTSSTTLFPSSLI